MSRARLSAVLLLTFASSLPAAAQSGPEEQLPPGVRSSDIPLGGLYLRPILALRDAGYDSNVFLTPVEEIDDITFTLSGGARLTGGVGWRGSAYVEQVVDYVWFKDQDSERGLNSFSSAGAQLGLGSFELTLDGRYAYTKDRPNLEIDARARRNEAAVGGTLRSDRERGLSFSVGGDIAFVRYDEDEEFQGSDLKETLDRDVYDVELVGYLEFGAASHLLLGYTRGREDYRAPDNIRDSDLTRAFTGVELDPQAPLNGEIRVGWAELDPDITELAGYNSLYLEANLNYEPHEDLRFSLDVAHEPRPSSFEDNVYYRATDVTARLLSYLSYHWGVQLSFTQAAHKYPQASSVPTPGGVVQERRKDDLTLFAGELLYRAFGNFHLGGGVSYRIRNSNLLRDDDESRWALTTTVGYLQ